MQEKREREQRKRSGSENLEQKCSISFLGKISAIFLFYPLIDFPVILWYSVGIGKGGEMIWTDINMNMSVLKY